MRNQEIKLIIITVFLILGVGVALGLYSYPDGIQMLIFGLLMGGFYALAALGLSLIYGVMGVLNFAHGDLLILGSYTSFWLFTLYGIDPLLSIFFTSLALGALGLILRQLVFKRTMKHGLDSTLLAGFGLMIILEELMRMAWSGDTRAITTWYSGSSIAISTGLVIPVVRLLSFGIATLLVIVLYIFMTRTYPGKALRASAIDKEAAGLYGINVGATYLMAFVLGTALAGQAGTLYAIMYSFTPTTGPILVLKLFTIVILGGLGSLLGTFLAALLIGVLESSVSFVMGAGYGDLLSLVVFLLVLIFKPKGLLGR
jgi:branched-chain amino acid transport system permease protein